MVGTQTQQLTAVYSTAAECSITVHKVAMAPAIARFRLEATATQRLIPPPETTFWRTFDRELRHLSFAIHHSVLPSCHESYNSLLSPSCFDDASLNLVVNAPEVVEQLVRLRQARMALSEEYISPYRDLLRSIVASPEWGSAVVIAEPRWVNSVKEHLKSAGNAKTLTVVSSKGADACGLRILPRLYVIGSIAVHPESLFAASRSADVHWLLYPWMKSDFLPRISLMSQLDKRWWRVGYDAQAAVPEIQEPNAVELVAPEENADEWTPRRDYWDAITSSQMRDSSGYAALVEAKMLAMSGDTVVYAPLRELVDIVDVGNLDDGQQIDIARKRGAEVYPGDHIIVYSRGNHQHVVSVADVLLGSNAETFRGMQSHWKNLLRGLVSKSSLEAVSLRLRAHGAPTAEPYNIRNWISPFFIRPNNKTDFEAIMALIGLQASTSEYWNVMVTIMTNHQLAGRRIKDRLKSRLEAMDVSVLTSSGRFDLGGDDNAGILTVVKVESVVSECASVPESSLLRLLE